MRGYKHTSRVYEPIYTVKNLYDDFIILQYFFPRVNYVFFTFLSGIWYYLQFIAKLSVWSPAIKQNVKKERVLTGSTFGIYSRFRSRMQTKQEPVDSLNFF